jgi:hypothetical protein
MPPLGPARALLAAAGLASFACVTPPAPQWTPPDPADASVSEGLHWLRGLAAERRSLRATARVSLSGAAGESFSRQLVLAEREARLRIEVIGVLGQRALVLASDGVEYDLYRADTGATESGPVDAGVLWRVAHIPLLPSEAVGLLLAAPAIPQEAPLTESGPAGELRFSWPDRSVTVDPATRAVIEVRLRAGAAGEELVIARFSDVRGTDTGTFPHRAELEFPAQRGAAVVEFREVELNPALDAKWFRLAPAQVSSAAGEPRP